MRDFIDGLFGFLIFVLLSVLVMNSSIMSYVLIKPYLTRKDDFQVIATSINNANRILNNFNQRIESLEKERDNQTRRDAGTKAEGAI